MPTVHTKQPLHLTGGAKVEASTRPVISIPVIQYFFQEELLQKSDFGSRYGKKVFFILVFKKEMKQCTGTLMGSLASVRMETYNTVFITFHPSCLKNTGNFNTQLAILISRGTKINYSTLSLKEYVQKSGYMNELDLLLSNTQIGLFLEVRQTSKKVFLATFTLLNRALQQKVILYTGPCW